MEVNELIDRYCSLSHDIREYIVNTPHCMKYDKGGWNSPNIKWWLDLELPINEEE